MQCDAEYRRGEGSRGGRVAPCNPDVARVRLRYRNRPPQTGSGRSRKLANVMDKIPLTRAGHAALNEELKALKSKERPAIIAAIAEAREHGDLSENAEYHAARERQSFVEGRVKEIEAILARAEVIDPSTLSGPIKFGATVRLVDEDTDEERTYQIVGEPEADLEKGLLNVRSPLARALIGKDEGDSVEVRTPGGERSYEILAINYA